MTLVGWQYRSHPRIVVPLAVHRRHGTSRATAATTVWQWRRRALHDRTTLMTYANFRLATDAAGIATVIWDMPGKSMNVFDVSVMDELEKIIAEIAGDAAITGAIITSGKGAFSGGADLNMLSGLL